MMSTWQRAAILTVALVLIFAGISPHVVSAQENVRVWNAIYFNNYFPNQPLITRYDPLIYFDWGTQSPGGTVPPDNFGARWETSAYFEEGVYRFYAYADDNVRIVIDEGEMVVDTFGKSQAGQLATADVPISAGVHQVRVDYGDFGGTAYVFVDWENVANEPTGPQPAFPVPGRLPNAPVFTPSLWTAEYFGNFDLQGTPTFTDLVPSPAIDWGDREPAPGVPADFFSVRFTGTVTVDEATYQITARADDAFRVYVNGELLINQFPGPNLQTFRELINLSAGTHTLVVEFGEVQGLAFMIFEFGFPEAGPIVETQTGTALVTSSAVNFRTSPTADIQNVISALPQGSTYPLLGRSSDGSWLQISVNGDVGWVDASYILVITDQAVTINVLPGPANPETTGYTVFAFQDVFIRSEPTINGDRVGALRIGESAQLIGRNADSSWWQINYGGTIGWVSAPLVEVEQGDFQVERVRVTG
jgi:uncharacterized protein YraI